MEGNNSDLINILEFSGEGMNLALKFSKGVLLKTAQLIMFLYHRHQTHMTGGVSFKKLVDARGTELEVLKIPFEDKGKLQEVYKELEKRGILFTPLDDLNIGDNYTEVMFHVSDSAKVKSFLEAWESLSFNKTDQAQEQPYNSKEGLNNHEAEKEAGKPFIISANEYAQDIPVDEMKKLQKQAVDEVSKNNPKSLSPEEEKGEKEKLQGIEKSENTEKISIDQCLFKHSDEKYFLSRIPGKRDEFLLLAKDIVTFSPDGKTAFATLKKEQLYPVVGKQSKVVRQIKGEDIHQHYDKSLKERAENHTKLKKLIPSKLKR